MNMRSRRGGQTHALGKAHAYFTANESTGAVWCARTSALHCTASYSGKRINITWVTWENSTLTNEHKQSE